ncbi:MAG: hypothetical protein AB1468_01550 [Candidatus Micrarchaeota archaeon]
MRIPKFGVLFILLGLILLAGMLQFAFGGFTQQGAYNLLVVTVEGIVCALAIFLILVGLLLFLI